MKRIAVIAVAGALAACGPPPTPAAPEPEPPPAPAWKLIPALHLPSQAPWPPGPPSLVPSMAAMGLAGLPQPQVPMLGDDQLCDGAACDPRQPPGGAIPAAVVRAALHTMVREVYASGLPRGPLVSDIPGLGLPRIDGEPRVVVDAAGHGFDGGVAVYRFDVDAGDFLATYQVVLTGLGYGIVTRSSAFLCHGPAMDPEPVFEAVITEPPLPPRRRPQ